MASRLPSNTELRAWRALMRVHSDLVESLDRELVEAEHLPLAWYEMLVTLRLAGGSMRMHELAEQLTLSRSAATRFVDRVEQAGLVVRTVCPTDRRGMLVALTAEGKQAQSKAARVALRGVREHFGRHLQVEQIEALACSLEAVLSGEGKAVPTLVHPS